MSKNTKQKTESHRDLDDSAAYLARSTLKFYNIFTGHVYSQSDLESHKLTNIVNFDWCKETGTLKVDVVDQLYGLIYDPAPILSSKLRFVISAESMMFRTGEHIASIDANIKNLYLPTGIVIVAKNDSTIRAESCILRSMIANERLNASQPNDMQSLIKLYLDNVRLELGDYGILSNPQFVLNRSGLAINIHKLLGILYLSGGQHGDISLLHGKNLLQLPGKLDVSILNETLLVNMSSSIHAIIYNPQECIGVQQEHNLEVRANSFVIQSGKYIKYLKCEVGDLYIPNDFTLKPEIKSFIECNKLIITDKINDCRACDHINLHISNTDLHFQKTIFPQNQPIISIPRLNLSHGARVILGLDALRNNRIKINTLVTDASIRAANSVLFLYNKKSKRRISIADISPAWNLSSFIQFIFTSESDEVLVRITQECKYSLLCDSSELKLNEEKLNLSLDSPDICLIDCSKLNQIKVKSQTVTIAEIFTLNTADSSEIIASELLIRNLSNLKEVYGFTESKVSLNNATLQLDKLIVGGQDRQTVSIVLGASLKMDLRVLHCKAKSRLNLTSDLNQENTIYLVNIEKEGVVYFDGLKLYLAESQWNSEGASHFKSCSLNFKKRETKHSNKPDNVCESQNGCISNGLEYLKPILNGIKSTVEQHFGPQNSAQLPSFNFTGNVFFCDPDELGQKNALSAKDLAIDFESSVILNCTFSFENLTIASKKAIDFVKNSEVKGASLNLLSPALRISGDMLLTKHFNATSDDSITFDYDCSVNVQDLSLDSNWVGLRGKINVGRHTNIISLITYVAPMTVFSTQSISATRAIYFNLFGLVRSCNFDINSLIELSTTPQVLNVPNSISTLLPYQKGVRGLIGCGKYALPSYILIIESLSTLFFMLPALMHIYSMINAHLSQHGFNKSSLLLPNRLRYCGPAIIRTMHMYNSGKQLSEFYANYDELQKEYQKSAVDYFLGEQIRLAVNIIVPESILEFSGLKFPSNSEHIQSFDVAKFMTDSHVEGYLQQIMPTNYINTVALRIVMGDITFNIHRSNWFIDFSVFEASLYKSLNVFSTIVFFEVAGKKVVRSECYDQPIREYVLFYKDIETSFYMDYPRSFQQVNAGMVKIKQRIYPGAVVKFQNTVVELNKPLDYDTKISLDNSQLYTIYAIITKNSTIEARHGSAIRIRSGDYTNDGNTSLTDSSMNITRGDCNQSGILNIDNGFIQVAQTFIAENSGVTTGTSGALKCNNYTNHQNITFTKALSIDSIHAVNHADGIIESSQLDILGDLSITNWGALGGVMVSLVSDIILHENSNIKATKNYFAKAAKIYEYNLTLSAETVSRIAMYRRSSSENTYNVSYFQDETIIDAEFWSNPKYTLSSIAGKFANLGAYDYAYIAGSAGMAVLLPQYYAALMAASLAKSTFYNLPSAIDSVNQLRDPQAKWRDAVHPIINIGNFGFTTVITVVTSYGAISSIASQPSIINHLNKLPSMPATVNSMKDVAFSSIDTVKGGFSTAVNIPSALKSYIAKQIPTNNLIYQGFQKIPSADMIAARYNWCKEIAINKISDPNTWPGGNAVHSKFSEYKTIFANKINNINADIKNTEGFKAATNSNMFLKFWGFAANEYARGLTLAFVKDFSVRVTNRAFQDSSSISFIKIFIPNPFNIFFGRQENTVFYIQGLSAIDVLSSITAYKGVSVGFYAHLASQYRFQSAHVIGEQEFLLFSTPNVITARKINKKYYQPEPSVKTEIFETPEFMEDEVIIENPMAPQPATLTADQCTDVRVARLKARGILPKSDAPLSRELTKAEKKQQKNLETATEAIVTGAAVIGASVGGPVGVFVGSLVGGMAVLPMKLFMRFEKRAAHWAKVDAINKQHAEKKEQHKLLNQNARDAWLEIKQIEQNLLSNDMSSVDQNYSNESKKSINNARSEVLRQYFEAKVNLNSDFDIAIKNLISHYDQELLKKQMQNELKIGINCNMHMGSTGYHATFGATTTGRNGGMGSMRVFNHDYDSALRFSVPNKTQGNNWSRPVLPNSFERKLPVAEMGIPYIRPANINADSGGFSNTHIRGTAVQSNGSSLIFRDPEYSSFRGYAQAESLQSATARNLYNIMQGGLNQSIFVPGHSYNASTDQRTNFVERLDIGVPFGPQNNTSKLRSKVSKNPNTDIAKASHVLKLAWKAFTGDLTPEVVKWQQHNRNSSPALAAAYDGVHGSNATKVVDAFADGFVDNIKKPIIFASEEVARYNQGEKIITQQVVNQTGAFIGHEVARIRRREQTRTLQFIDSFGKFIGADLYRLRTGQNTILGANVLRGFEQLSRMSVEEASRFVGGEVANTLLLFGAGRFARSIGGATVQSVNIHKLRSPIIFKYESYAHGNQYLSLFSRHKEAYACLGKQIAGDASVIPQHKFDLWYNYLTKRGVKFEIGSAKAMKELALSNADGQFVSKLVSRETNYFERIIYLPENYRARVFYEEVLHALDSIKGRPTLMEFNGLEIDAFEYRAKNILINSAEKRGFSYDDFITLENHLEMVMKNTY